MHWAFWIVALLIGGGIYATTPEDWMRVLVAMGVIFVSILVHELGHGFAGRRYGARPEILLHGFGGLCYLPNGNFSRKENILVSLAGPGAGFALAFATYILLLSLQPQNPYLLFALAFSLWVNVVWTVLNLLPILPLDGGQVFRDLLGPSRMHITRTVGMITGAALCYLAFRNGLYILAFFAAALAFANYRGHLIEGGVARGRPGH